MIPFSIFHLSFAMFRQMPPVTRLKLGVNKNLLGNLIRGGNVRSYCDEFFHFMQERIYEPARINGRKNVAGSN
jgi:hypothetical protein